MKGYTNEERTRQAVEKGKLEYKRFDLPEKNLRENLHKLKESFLEIKKDHPEIISIMVHGSYTKGYADKSSDLDLEGVIELDRAREVFLEQCPPETPESEKDDFHVKIFYQRMLAEKLEKIPDIPKISMGGSLISRELIDKALSEGQDAYIQTLFQLSLDRGIDSYRKYIIDRLEEEGSLGQQKWQKFMETIHLIENIGMNEVSEEVYEKRKKFYPTTLNEARKYWHLQ